MLINKANNHYSKTSYLFSCQTFLFVNQDP